MRRRRFGFTIIEVVVAATLSAGFGIIVSMMLNASSISAKTSILKASSEQQLRDLNGTVTRYLHGIKPLDYCLDGAVPLSDCLTVATESTAFLVASPDTLEFYAYTDAISGSLELSAPDKVSVKTRMVSEVVDGVTLTGYVLDVTVTVASAPNDYSGLGLLRRSVTLRPLTVNGVNPVPVPFGFRSSDGAALCTSIVSLCPLSDLENIRVVTVSPTVNVTSKGFVRVFALPVYIKVQDKGFGG